MPLRFEPETLSTLETIEEIELETTTPDGGRTHRTIIWVVTVGDQVFVRSVNGSAARWYREARQTPDLILHAGDESIPVTAVLAADPGSVQRVSDAFKAKYARRSAASTASMLQPHTLETTMRLEPTAVDSPGR